MPMRSAHTHLKLEDEHFDAWIECLVDSLEENGVNQADVEIICGQFEAMRVEVLNK